MKKLFLLLLVGSVLLIGGNAALALPFLQLDIVGGTYDWSTETVVATSDVFTLRALADPSKGDATADFYLSAALIPGNYDQNYIPDHTLDYGSFTVNGGTPIAVTADMLYGTPPVSDASADLPSHEIYETYYKEFMFNFDPTVTIAAYNSQPGGTVDAPGDLLLVEFEIDVSGLHEGYELHFDLYALGNPITKAPFSHDAQSGDIPDTPIPEPSTVFLLGIGLLGILGLGRKLKK